MAPSAAPERGAMPTHGGQDNAAWLNSERVEKVPELVARRILRDIVDRGLSTGDHLPPEAGMVSQFGVGRASLREALRILETHGLIRMRTGAGGGPVVTDVSSTEYGRMTSLYLFRAGGTYEELIEARLVIEPMMVRLAAERLTDETAQRLRDVVEEGEALADAPATIWYAISERFHAVIAGMTGNHVLDLFSAALVSIERRHLGPVYQPGDRAAALKTHRRIAEAILAQNASQAEQLARRHIIEVERTLRDKYQVLLEERVHW
jgi:GntR family transcriptional regulator, transcriptional repressor for pyruvate dehydrogenase complex